MTRLSPRNVLFALYVAICALALTWPVYDLLGNRVEPLVLGLPFTLAWNVGWVLAGPVVGSAVTVVLVAYPGLKPWPLHAGIYGLVLNLLTLVVFSALGRSRDPDSDAAFLSVASGRT